MHNNSVPNLQRIRVTLDFEVLEDSFHPRQIDYHSLFDINSEQEKLTVTVEDLSGLVDTLWEQSYDVGNNYEYDSSLYLVDRLAVLCYNLK